TAPQLSYGRSCTLGVSRLTERFVRTDPLAPRDERRLVKHVNREIGEYLGAVAEKKFDRVTAASGTMLSVGALALSDSGLRAPGEEALRNQRVPAKAIHKLR